MLRLAAIFLAAAFIAGLFGFSGLNSGSEEIGRILFFCFVAGFAVSLLRGLLSDRPSDLPPGT